MTTRYVWEKRTPPGALSESVRRTITVTRLTANSVAWHIYSVAAFEPVYDNAWKITDIKAVGKSSSAIAAVQSSREVSLSAGYYIIEPKRSSGDYASPEWNCRIRLSAACDLIFENLEYHDNGYGTDTYTADIRASTGTLYSISINNAVGNELVGYVASSFDSTYDTTQLVGGYRYIYSGSDNIDPSAVSSPADPRGGQSTTVTVTPGSGKVYDGTVSYRYEYSVNGGTSWVLIGTTTETSQQVTIPEGAPSFQARVRAQDDLGFTSSTYVYSEQVTVINNEPPTAPGSISVGQILAGQAVTITLTAATDTDGTVVKYIYERSIDGSGWSQIAEVNALTYTDNIGTEWATVAYRACAVDDDGAAGPYVTGETSTVNEGILYISGPAPDMGTVFAIFTAQIGVGVTGTAASDVTLYVDMDGQCLYDGLVDTGETVPIEIDTRLLSSGEHVIAATASKSGYIQASALFKFSTAAGLAGGGLMMQLSDHTGKAIFPRTVAAAVEGLHVPTAQTVVLSASEWTQDGSRYKQAVSVAAVLQRSPAVFVDCALSDDHDANEAIIEAWGPVMSFKPKQADGSLTFYAAEAPDINIPITVVVL